MTGDLRKRAIVNQSFRDTQSRVMENVCTTSLLHHFGIDIYVHNKKEKKEEKWLISKLSVSLLLRLLSNF